MVPDIKFALTISLKFLCLGYKMIQNYHSNFERALNVHSKYDGSCSIYIMKASCVALGANMIKIEQLPPYICALNNS